MQSDRKDSGLSPEVEAEVQKHHKSLRQFIDVSFDATASQRKNSKRATKAREKLLKLSQAQFVELSTDVYDELHRRINETKDEPDHLLPKESFHPKRNQAREKLASLPAQRFKDLVNDILYEIERRGLHVPRKDEQPAAALYRGVQEDESVAEPRIASNDSALQAAQHGVQSKRVIPTKATMAWSSDEEDEEDIGNRDLASPVQQQQQQAQQQFVDNDPESIDVVAPELQDKVPEMVNLGSPGKHASGSSIKRGLSINKEREIQMLMEEAAKMDGKITQLERALDEERKNSADLQAQIDDLVGQLGSKTRSHDDEVAQLQAQLSDAPNKNEFVLLKSQYDALQSSHSMVASNHSNALQELEALKAQNRDLKSKSRDLTSSRGLSQNGGSIDDSAIAQIQAQLADLSFVNADFRDTGAAQEQQAQAAQLADAAKDTESWKTKFEEARSGTFVANLQLADVSDAAFQDSVSDDSGLITFKQLADFQASLESFYLLFNSATYNKNDLLKSVSLIATRADLMCSATNETKLTSVVRACVTHSIVVARQYLADQRVLPSTVLSVAVNDVALSVCDLVKSCKLLSESKEDRSVAKTAVSGDATTTPLMGKDFPVPGSFADRNDTASPVRPLKMIERMNSPSPAVGNGSSGSNNGRFESSNDRDLSVQEKRSQLANSPLAPITTQVVPHTSSGERQAASSPRGPNIFSMVNKLGSKTGTSEPVESNGTKQSPTASKNILDRIKKFDSPEQEDATVTRREAPQISNASTEAFEKFGAKRRSSSSVVSDPNSKTNFEPQHPDTDVDLNEVPVPPTKDISSTPVAERQLQDTSYDKAAVAANFNVDNFNIANPDNTLHELLLYLEHQTIDVITTIQTLLASIKKQDSTRGVLRESAKAINEVVGQMTEATNTSMGQTRNTQLREHGTWMVQNLEDCGRRMEILCGANNKASDAEYADKNFKQRLAGVAFDIAKSTKELVKSVEEASLKQEIEVLDARLTN